MLKKLDIDKLSSLQRKLEKLDVGKLLPVPVDLSNLTDIVKSEIVKKTAYDKLVKKVNVIQTTDTSDLIKEADYDKKKLIKLKKIKDY